MSALLYLLLIAYMSVHWKPTLAWEQDCLLSCVLTCPQLFCSVSVLHAPAFQALTLQFLQLLFWDNPFHLSIHSPIHGHFLFTDGNSDLLLPHTDKYISSADVFNTMPSVSSLGFFFFSVALFMSAEGFASSLSLSLSLLITSLILLDNHYIPYNFHPGPQWSKKEKKSLVWHQVRFFRPCHSDLLLHLHLQYIFSWNHLVSRLLSPQY